MDKTLEEHNYHSIDATIIADSKNEFGQRITSFVCTFPRIVLSEFNTHRMLSRNSASSRAIPFDKMVKDVEEHPFIPIKWMKDHKGMQGTEFVKETDIVDVIIHHKQKTMNAIEACNQKWLEARDKAVESAKVMSHMGITKQFVNRLLEPFKWHTVICTATDYQNFFALRAHEAAEIHIQALAFKMLEEYNNSEPKQLKAGECHIPFGDEFDEEKLTGLAYHAPTSSMIPEHLRDIEQLKVKIATARCARVSYENFEGGDDYQKDIDLHDRLASMGHWSPFEHCAKAMSEHEFSHHVRGIHVKRPDDNWAFERKDLGWSGNFHGFVQYRKMFNNENKKDERIK